MVDAMERKKDEWRSLYKGLACVIVILPIFMILAIKYKSAIYPVFMYASLFVGGILIVYIGRYLYQLSKDEPKQVLSQALWGYQLYDTIKHVVKIIRNLFK